MSFDIFIGFFKKVNYKRILPLLAFPLLFISLSPVRAFAYESVPGDVLENSWKFHNTDYSFFSAVRESGGGSEFISSDTYSPEEIESGASVYNFRYDNDFSNIQYLRIFNYDARFDFEFAPELYDYYFLANFWYGLDAATSSRFTFFPTAFSFETIDNDLNISEYRQLSSKFYTTELHDTVGFCVFAPFPYISSNQNVNFSGLKIYGSGSLPKSLNFEGMVVAVPRGANYTNVLNNILTELLRQGSSIDNIDYVLQVFLTSGLFNFETGESGSFLGQDTESILGGLVGGNSQLDSYINEYTQVEQSMHDKFFENQTAVQTNFSNWSWGSLATCVDWTSDYLNQIYDNSGDFRTMFMYPVLAGIALIFIGRQGMAAYIRSKNNKRGD